MSTGLRLRKFRPTDPWPIRWWSVYRRFLWNRYRLTSHAPRSGEVIEAHGSIWIYEVA